jgi:cation transport protein ChaC
VDLLFADWVFGYGSLIWNPEVDFNRSELGRVHGYHRAFCIRSTRYRGTPEQPGVVLGLESAGAVASASPISCATKPAATPSNACTSGKCSTSVYVPTLAAVTLANGRQVRALTFVANRDSDAYQRLSEHEILSRLSGCCGQRGANRDYAVNTHLSLQERGVHDARLARLVYQLRASGHA